MSSLERNQYRQLEEYVAVAVLIENSCERGFCCRFGSDDRIRFGIAIAAMIRMIATTISS